MARKVTEEAFEHSLEIIQQAMSRGEVFAKETRTIAAGAKGTASSSQSKSDKALNEIKELREEFKKYREIKSKQTDVIEMVLELLLDKSGVALYKLDTEVSTSGFDYERNKGMIHLITPSDIHKLGKCDTKIINGVTFFIGKKVTK